MAKKFYGVTLDPVLAEEFMKRYPRSMAKAISRVMYHALRSDNFLFDLEYCDYDNETHSFKSIF